MTSCYTESFRKCSPGILTSEVLSFPAPQPYDCILFPAYPRQNRSCIGDGGL